MLFLFVVVLQCGELVEFLCKCSFLEIYNEQVYDLLDPASVGLRILCTTILLI